jgi:uncharacterized protein YndB with AHSA1/START domain
MGERSVEHASFSIERRYDVPPATVFEAWADAGAKARWFSEHQEWLAGPLELDFRVGGREVQRSGPQGGPVHTYRAIYWIAALRRKPAASRPGRPAASALRASGR